MTRPISTAVAAGIVPPITVPRYLVEIDFPSPFRASSGGIINWNGLVFVPFGMKVKGLGSDSTTSASTGSIVFNDLNNALGTLILGQTFGGAPITVWVYYGDPAGPGYSLGLTDPTEIFSGYGGDAKFDINNGTIEVSMQQANGPGTYIPRFYLTRENGFSFLPAPGTVLTWGNGQVVLWGE